MPNHNTLLDIFIAPPEYIIIQKLLYWEEGGHLKHLDDILAMLQVQGEKISKATVVEHLSSTVQKEKFIEICQKLEG